METSNLARDTNATKNDCVNILSVNEINSQIFLGNLTVARDNKWLKRTGITHILTLDCFPLKPMEDSWQTKFIQVTDISREDMLAHLQDCYEFIESAVNSNGKILVHCYYGVSRSATVVIAYFMKKYHLSLHDAYYFVKARRNLVCPNDGFLAQLRLYESMGCDTDNSNVSFKLYKLQIAADKVRKAKILPQDSFHLIKNDPALPTTHPEAKTFRCRKCRRILANASHLLPHLPNEKLIWRYLNDKDHKKSIEDEIKNEESSCKEIDTSYCQKTYFIEPISWMKNITNSPEGKLNCPKCNSKLGSFGWVNGRQCPCGCKIAPAFYLTPSRVDLTDVVKNVESTV